VARGYGLSLSALLREESLPRIRVMARHLPALLEEEAEFRAAVLTRRLVEAGLDLLEALGIVKRTGAESDPEAPEIMRAERLLEDFLHR